MRQPVENRAQVFADDSADFAGVSHHILERAVLAKPLGRCFRADLGDSWNVVDRIAGKREQIEHLIRGNAKFCHHRLLIEPFVAHRVHERDTGLD